MKKTLSIFLALIFICSASAFAAGNDVDVAIPEVVYLESRADLYSIDIVPGVIYIWPNEEADDTEPLPNIGVGSSLLRGASPPATDWNVATDGRYAVSGNQSAFGNYLYSNYRFVGAGSRYYWVEISNKRSSALTVECNTKGILFETVHRTMSVPANSTMGMTPTLPEEWYLRITGPSNFEGFVDRW